MKKLLFGVLVSLFCLGFVSVGCDKLEDLNISAPTPGLLDADGDFWYGLRNWTVVGPVEIWPDRLHNVDSFCVIRRGGSIKYTGSTYRVIHDDTISLAGNYCFLTNFSWWTGARMNFSLKLMNNYGAVLLQTNGVVVGDYYTQINVHNFTAPTGVTNYELTYWTEQDSAMVDGCVLRQYPNQTPPPPPPPPVSPETVWTLASVQIAKNGKVRYPGIKPWGHQTLTIDADVRGEIIGSLSWSTGTASIFRVKDSHLRQTFPVPLGATYLAVNFFGRGTSGATVTNVALHK